MYAIVEIAGKQYKVTPQMKVYVPHFDAEVDSTVSFDRVLLIGGESTQIGTPVVSGASISATVLAQVKSDKILVFKKKRRKRYRVMRGHRQQYTQVQIDAINVQ